MRPQAGVGKLKHAPQMRAIDLPLVAQAVSPANRGRLTFATTARQGRFAARPCGDLY